MPDIDAGVIEFNVVASKLHGKGIGAFLLYFNKEEERHLIAVKTSDEKGEEEDNITSIPIKTIEIQGITYYYLEKGISSQSILGLVQQHRMSHQLFVPCGRQVKISFELTFLGPRVWSLP